MRPPAATQLETGIACGSPPPVERIATVPGRTGGIVAGAATAAS
jgi:hypothetical protein